MSLNTFVQDGMTRRSNVKLNKPHGHLLMLGLRFISFFRVDLFSNFRFERDLLITAVQQLEDMFSTVRTNLRSCLNTDLLDLRTDDRSKSVYCCNKTYS
jgi:hypothetical protein